MSRVVKYYCDRCKKEAPRGWKDFIYWIIKPGFKWGFKSIYLGSISNNKVNLCNKCFEKAKRFFYGWGD